MVQFLGIRFVYDSVREGMVGYGGYGRVGRVREGGVIYQLSAG